MNRKTDGFKSLEVGHLNMWWLRSSCYLSCRKHDVGFPYLCFTPKGKLVKHVKHPYPLNMNTERAVSFLHSILRCFAALKLELSPWKVIEGSPVGPPGGFFVEFLGVLLYCILDIWKSTNRGMFPPQPGNEMWKPRDHQRFHDRLSMRYMTYTYLYIYLYMNGWCVMDCDC